MTHITTLRRLRELAKLEAGWDSYDASPITEVSIQATERLLECLKNRSPDCTVPLSGGGVQLEWSGPGGEIEVEIQAYGQFGVLVSTGTEPDRKFSEADNMDLAAVVQNINHVLGFEGMGANEELK